MGVFGHQHHEVAAPHRAALGGDEQPLVLSDAAHVADARSGEVEVSVGAAERREGAQRVGNLQVPIIEHAMGTRARFNVTRPEHPVLAPAMDLAGVSADHTGYVGGAVPALHGGLRAHWWPQATTAGLPWSKRSRSMVKASA